MKTDLPNNIAITLSGGIDSTTVLSRIVTFTKSSPEINIVGITFKYNSKHNQLEREAAKLIAEHYDITLLTIDLRTLFQGYQSSMLNPDVDIPQGHYEADNMKSTVVHLRNLIFATAAASRAMEYFDKDVKKILLAMGVHSGDHHVYPDCRPETINALGHAIFHGSGNVVGLYAPYLHVPKDIIVGQGLGFDAPYHLTRTCYTGDERACGKCGSCVERLEAFEKHNTPDPIKYAVNTTVFDDI